MARKCSITGKGPNTANNVPFSQKKTKRRQMPNLQTKRIFVPEVGRMVRIKLSTEALRNMDKKGGLMAYLADEGLQLKDVIE